MLCKVPKVCHVGYAKAVIEARHDKKKYPDLDEQLKKCASCDMENLLCSKCENEEIPSLDDVHSVHSDLSGLPNFEIFKFWRREHEALACPFSRHTKCVRDEEFDKNEVYYRYRLIDLAGFKALNDRLSHTVGDDMISSMAVVLSGFIAELRGYNHIAAVHRSGDEFYISEIMCPLLHEREIKSRGIAGICEQFYHALKKQTFWFRLPRDNREMELEQHGNNDPNETNHWLGVYENGHEHDFPFTLLSGVQIHGEDIAPQQDNDNRRGMFPDDFALFVGNVESMCGDWLPFNNYISWLFTSLTLMLYLVF